MKLPPIWDDSHVAVDFEFYYDKEVSIKTLGFYHALANERSDVYQVALWAKDWQWVGRPEEAPWKDIRDQKWVSHNRSADKRVHDFLVERKLINSKDHPDWECTADLAAYLGVKRALKDAAFIMLEQELSKDVRKLVKGVTYADMQTQTIVEKEGKTGKITTSLAPCEPGDPTLLDFVKDYGLKDTKPCWELWARYGNRWPEDERLLSRMTTRQAHRGLRVDVRRMEQDIAALIKYREALAEELPWVAPGLYEGALSIPALKKEIKEVFKIEPPVCTSEDSEACRAWELRHPKCTWIKTMREFRKTNILLKRYQHVQSRVEPNGRFAFAWKYCGAHTRRWAGGSSEQQGGTGESGFNVQNMNKESFKAGKHECNLRAIFIA